MSISATVSSIRPVLTNIFDFAARSCLYCVDDEEAPTVEWSDLPIGYLIVVW